MAEILLGIGDIAASGCPGDTLVTLALGSCVAVVVRDPRSGAVGMAHVALPTAPPDGPRGALPGYYASTAIPALFRAMERVGGAAGPQGLEVRLIGGATIIDMGGSFNIGKRNILGIKRLLMSYGLTPVAEDLGGQVSRSVRVEVPSGLVRVSSPGLPPWAV